MVRQAHHPEFVEGFVGFMNFSYNWLQSFFKKKLPTPENLAELLTLHSFEVKEVKKIGKDFILDIDVLPNRGPDCFSHLGVAREISAITGYPLRVTDYFVKEAKNLKAKDFVKIEVKEGNACPRYTARIIKGVKVASSPNWLKEKLRVCGLQPINNIVDVANYVMLETGQPLHAFDLEKLEDVIPNSKFPISKKISKSKFEIKEIIVRFAKDRERIVTLDEKTYELNSEILVIADAKNPVAIAGTKGGVMPKIDRKTKIIVLESANFNPKIIRRGSKKLNLKTDASLRFEHGIDPNLTEFAINRATVLIKKIAGGKIAKGLIDIYPKRIPPRKIILDLEYVNKLLGVEISKNEIKDILQRLNFKITETPFQTKANKILVTVPIFRLDIAIPEDLIEEVGRIFGFQKIPARPPLVSLIPPERNLSRFWEDFIREILRGAGFSEVYNYSFISEKDTKIFEWKPGNLIEIENPTNENQRYLRPSLIPNLLKNVKENIKNFDEIKIFELGKVFKKDPTGKVVEKKVLSGLMVQPRSPSKTEIFFELKGICDLVLEKCGISNFWYDAYQPTPEDYNPPKDGAFRFAKAPRVPTTLPAKGRAPSKIAIWHPQKCAEIKVDHEEIGFLGEISPKILDTLGIGNITVFDFDFEKLKNLALEEHEFRPLSKYPAAIRDLAVLVPPEVKVEDVLNVIEITGGSLVRDVDLFDIYEGEKIPEGKKNLAFHIIFQAEDRTLSSKEIDKIQKKIIAALEENPEWQVRRQ